MDTHVWCECICVISHVCIHIDTCKVWTHAQRSTQAHRHRHTHMNMNKETRAVDVGTQRHPKTWIHTQIPTHSYMCTQTCAHSYIHPHMWTHTQRSTNAHCYRDTHARDMSTLAYVHIYACRDIHVYTDICTCVQTCKHAGRHTVNAHSYTHARTVTYSPGHTDESWVHRCTRAHGPICTDTCTYRHTHACAHSTDTHTDVHPVRPGHSVPLTPASVPCLLHGFLSSLLVLCLPLEVHPGALTRHPPRPGQGLRGHWAGGCSLGPPQPSPGC